MARTLVTLMYVTIFSTAPIAVAALLRGRVISRVVDLLPVVR